MTQALGAHVTLVTGVHPAYDRSVFTGITVHAVPAASNPRYANTYDSDGNRTQELHDEGAPLGEVDFAPLGRADVCVAAPAYHELNAYPPVPADTPGVSLQGTLRLRGSDNRVGRRLQAFEAARPMAPAGSFAFLSEEDTADAHGLARALADTGVHVIVTHGYRGATLFDAATETAYPAFPTRSVTDPTGAGDCFSTAFLVRYAETGSVGAAMNFALAAGALSVEGEALMGIPSRDAIEDRLAQVAA